MKSNGRDNLESFKMILIVLIVCSSLFTRADPMIKSSYHRSLLVNGDHDGIENRNGDAIVSKLTVGATTSTSNRHLKNDGKSHLRGKPKKEDKIYRRRNLDAKSIDYGGSHPYEVMERRRRLKVEAAQYQRNAMKIEYENFWYESSFSLDEFIDNEKYDLDDDFDIEKDKKDKFNVEVEEKFDRSEFRPIRIRLDSNHLFENFQSETKKNEFIIYHVLPAAIQFWVKALKVYPAKRLFIDNSKCLFASSNDFVQGRNDADLVLYLSANQSCTKKQDSGSFDGKADAQSCDNDQYDRPIGGWIDFCYQAFELDEHHQVTSMVLKEMIETAIHEIGHVLGLTSGDMAYYHDKTTGLPRTPRPFKSNDSTICVNGKNATDFDPKLVTPSQNTLRLGALYPGIRYYEVVTPTVRQVARNHFNCDRMEGMRLENQPTSDDCFGDNWEERLAYGAQMSSIRTDDSIPSHLSPFTLALLEDTGWYQANFSMSKVTSFGHGSGCDFVEKPCIDKDNTVPEFGKGFFCNTMDRTELACDPSHHTIASCDLYDLSELKDQNYPPIPYVFRYFDNAAMGPKKMQQADFCPTFSERFISCVSDKPSWLDEKNDIFVKEEKYGIDSRCFNSNSGRPLCLESFCDHELGVIKVNFGQEQFKCEYDDQVIDVQLSGETYQIECPKKAVLCPDMICPSDCRGEEICNWDLDMPICQRYQLMMTETPAFLPINSSDTTTKIDTTSATASSNVAESSASPSSLSSITAVVADSSDVPSSLPSITTSPSTIPSLLPSSLPSITAVVADSSDVPSSLPSITTSPSDIPSITAVVADSSDVPSSLPSITNSPSTMPSLLPSSLPSIATIVADLSDVPSSLPSITTSPSTIPSSLPSITTVVADSSAVPSSALMVPDQSNSSKVWFKNDSIYGEFGNRRQYDYFGARISLSKDGTTLAIGSPKFETPINGIAKKTGRVQIFTKSGNGSWEKLGETIFGNNTGDRFGTSVTLSESGETVAIGADRFPPLSGTGSNVGFVQVYRLSNGTWSLVGDTLIGKQCTNTYEFQKYFGKDVSLSNDGDLVAIGGLGLVCVFEWEIDEGWTLVGSPIGANADRSSKDFGASVELAGQRKVVAVFQPNAYLIYKLDDTSSWVQLGQTIEIGPPNEAGSKSRIGKNLAISDDGKTIATPNNAKIYRLNGTKWDDMKQSLVTRQEDDIDFAESVSMSRDGRVLAIGTMQKMKSMSAKSGYVKVIELVGDEWVQRGEVMEGLDKFGGSVSISGDGSVLIAGSFDHETTSAGYVKVYEFVLPPSESPSLAPSISSAPSISAGPSISISTTPSISKSDLPSEQPSILTSDSPSEQPSISAPPSISITEQPSEQPSTLISAPPSEQPSIETIVSASPSVSNEPTLLASLAPSLPPLSLSPVPDLFDLFEWMNDDSIYGEFGFDRINDYFGARISLSKDGTTLAIGSPKFVNGNAKKTGRVQIFTKSDDGSWNQIGETIFGNNAGDRFGTSVTLSESGETVAIGADRYNLEMMNPPKNYVQVYRLSNGSWSLVGDTLTGKQCINDNSFHDYFGWDVSLSNDGDLVAIGGLGIVCIFEWEINDGWTLVGSPIGADDEALSSKDFGASVELAGQRKVVAVFQPNAYLIYKLDDTSSWVQLGQTIEIGPPNEAGSKSRIGKNLAISDDGKTIATPNNAKIYRLNGTKWDDMKQSLVTRQEDDIDFAESISMSSDGRVLAIGTMQAKDSAKSGYVKVIELVGDEWVQRGEVMEGLDKFGGSVSISGDGSVLIAGSFDHETTSAGYVKVYEFELPTSESPSLAPSISSAPSTMPSVVPSEFPSEVPTQIPSEVPTQTPSEVPTVVPTKSASPTSFDEKGTGKVDGDNKETLPKTTSEPTVSPTTSPTEDTSPTTSPTEDDDLYPKDSTNGNDTTKLVGDDAQTDEGGTDGTGPDDAESMGNLVAPSRFVTIGLSLLVPIAYLIV